MFYLNRPQSQEHCRILLICTCHWRKYQTCLGYTWCHPQLFHAIDSRYCRVWCGSTACTSHQVPLKQNFFLTCFLIAMPQLTSIFGDPTHGWNQTRDVFGVSVELGTLHFSANNVKQRNAFIRLTSKKYL